MARRKLPREEEALHCTLIAMIDVVFQLIIFFVCTVSMQDKSMDERIRLAAAPHGKPVAGKDYREIKVDVDSHGNISVCRTRLSESLLYSIIKKGVAETGPDTPVLIRADGATQHGGVKKVMDACSRAGIYRIKFVALKERAKASLESVQ